MSNDVRDLATIATFYRRVQWAALALGVLWVVWLLAPILSPFVFAALLGWLGEVREELSKPQAPALADLLGAYYGARSAGAWSNRGKVGNLQKFADTVNYLTEQ